MNQLSLAYLLGKSFDAKSVHLWRRHAGNMLHALTRDQFADFLRAVPAAGEHIMVWGMQEASGPRRQEARTDGDREEMEFRRKYEAARQKNPPPEPADALESLASALSALDATQPVIGWDPNGVDVGIMTDGVPGAEVRLAFHLYAARLGLFAPELYGDTHATWVNCTNKGQPRGRGAIGLNHTESGVTVMFRVAAMRVMVENPGSKGAGMMQRRLAAVGQV